MIHDTEDRHYWYRHGERQEDAFIQLMNRQRIRVRKNPEKYLASHPPDLIVDGELSELKAQTTPFFTSRRYGIPPRYAATFNRKDYERYLADWPEIFICFWINWTHTVWNFIVVEPMNQVFGIHFADLRGLIADAPEHFYTRRKTDVRPNAKSSFVLDVRDMPLLLDFDEVASANLVEPDHPPDDANATWRGCGEAHQLDFWRV